MNGSGVDWKGDVASILAAEPERVASQFRGYLTRHKIGIEDGDTIILDCEHAHLDDDDGEKTTVPFRPTSVGTFTAILPYMAKAIQARLAGVRMALSDIDVNARVGWYGAAVAIGSTWKFRDPSRIYSALRLAELGAFDGFDELAGACLLNSSDQNIRVKSCHFFNRAIAEITEARTGQPVTQSLVTSWIDYESKSADTPMSQHTAVCNAAESAGVQMLYFWAGNEQFGASEEFNVYDFARDFNSAAKTIAA